MVREGEALFYGRGSRGMCSSSKGVDQCIPEKMTIFRFWLLADCAGCAGCAGFMLVLAILTKEATGGTDYAVF